MIVKSKNDSVLTGDFFERSTSTVAEEIIGKFLCRNIDGHVYALPINEVEVYDGFDDKASHAHCGKTQRNSIMFDDPGFWYIYLCYGVHWLLNIVTGQRNYPAAVLIRGAGSISGPGKLTKALSINKNNNNTIAAPKSKLWIEDRNLIISKSNIKRTPRIGINNAGTVWKNKNLRFLWDMSQ